MMPKLDKTEPAPKDEQNAFDLWFGQTLKDIYEPVMHEQLPPAILAALPPQTNEG